MICLGIESTAHTIGVGIVKGKRSIKALANEKQMYTTSGGIHPREAAQFISKNAPQVMHSALQTAGITLEEVDVFSFSRGPGLGPCLQTSFALATFLSSYYHKPLVGVNHCIAHIEVGKWQHNIKDPLTVYVSGANTQILALHGKRYRVFGETLDIGLGNALDTFGRNKGLDFPAGPKIERLAKKGSKLVELPYTVKGMDLAFSGLVTSASKKTDSLPDLCFSFQETAFSMLCEVVERALSHTKKKSVLLVGGVAQNARLSNMLREMSAEHNAGFYVPKNEYNGDNGLMIALTGLKQYNAQAYNKGFPDQFWRTDDLVVKWA